MLDKNDRHMNKRTYVVGFDTLKECNKHSHYNHQVLTKIGE
jgi:hypothetical protein